MEDEPAVRRSRLDALAELDYRVLEVDGAAKRCGLSMPIQKPPCFLPTLSCPKQMVPSSRKKCADADPR